MEAALQEFLSIITGEDDTGFFDLLTDDAVIWHNSDGIDMPARDAFGGIGMLRALVDDLSAHVISEDPVPSGVVARIELRGTVKSNGKPVCMRLADFITIVDGRITRIDEYVDPSVRAQLGV